MIREGASLARVLADPAARLKPPRAGLAVHLTPHRLPPSRRDQGARTMQAAVEAVGADVAQAVLVTAPAVVTVAVARVVARIGAAIPLDATVWLFDGKRRCWLSAIIGRRIGVQTY